MVKRKDGKLCIDILDLEIFIGDLFEKCKNLKEIEFLREVLIDYVDICAEDREEEI